MAFTVAVLGFGVMGSGMARSLRKGGFDVAVWNRTREKVQPFADEGGRIARTPAAAVQGAALVISMLVDDAASRAAWLEEDGALAATHTDAIAVESSTISPAWVDALHTATAARGIPMLDAPVTGSRAQAAAGQLVFLAGGDAAVVQRAKPILAAMSKQVLHVGPVGSGAQLKLVNNFLCGVQIASFAEAVAWIERTGLDRNASLEFLKTAAPGSAIVATMAARMSEHAYDVNFALDLMRKDLHYAHAAAEQFHVPLSTAANAEALFARAQCAGYGERDMSAVVEVLRNDAAGALTPNPQSEA